MMKKHHSSEPVNMGCPFNSAASDLFFRYKGSNQDTFFLASNRKDGYGGLDIYGTGNFMETFQVGVYGPPSLETIIEKTEDALELVEEIQEIAEDLIDTTSTEEETLEDDDLVAEEIMTEESDNVMEETMEEEETYETEAMMEEESTKEPMEEEVSYREPTATNLATDKILFDFDQDVLRPEAIQILDQTASNLMNNPQAKLEISGHTDFMGSEAYNIDLAIRRIKSVLNYLENKGISKDRLFGKCYGESMPASSNETAMGRQQNRRAEIHPTDDTKIIAYNRLEKINGIYIDKGLFLMGKFGNATYDGLSFSVQIGAFRNAPATSDPMYTDVSDIRTTVMNDGLTRITSGTFNTISEASLHKDKLFIQFPGAFVVPYYNGERVSMLKAMNILSGK